MTTKDLLKTLDKMAETLKGEYGFFTCSENEQLEIIQLLINKKKNK